jgi:hypothetical protein
MCDGFQVFPLSFRFPAAFRYPPAVRVSDRQIQDIILALRTRHGRITGARVRAELDRQFGVRGGVARIYRLVAQARDGRALLDTRLDTTLDINGLAARVAELERALAVAVERATLAEHREVAHQERAASQIYALREQLREAQESPRVQGVRHEDYLQVHRALAAARLRIAELEARAAGSEHRDDPR